MKRLTLLFILIAFPVYAQLSSTLVYGPLHQNYLEKTVKLESTESDTLIIAFAPRKVGGGTFVVPTLYDGAYIDSTASDPLPYVNWTARDVVWSGYAEFDLLITNTDLATDSMLVQCYALDRNGVARANDYVYLKFDSTPPGYSTTAYYNGASSAWVTATSYHGSLTGAFPLGTFGLAIIFNPTDETASHTGLLRFRANIY